MSLKQLVITDVREVGVHIPALSMFTPRVEVVEVLDQDGNPWEPVPGPDPWDELVVKADTYWSSLNDYSPGSEVFAHPAIFLGGNPENTTYRYRWQYQSIGSDTWNSGSWATYSNAVLEVGYVIPDEAAGGKVRLMSQARDTTDPENVEQVNSFVAAEDVERHTIGTLTRYIDTEDYPEVVPIEIPFLDTSLILNVVPTGNSPNITYDWSLRTGTARLTDQGPGVCSVVFNTSGAVMIQVTAQDINSSDLSATALFEFFVSDT